MIALKFLSLAFLAAAVVLFVRTLYEELTSSWNQRIQTYAMWMTVEFESMFEEMTVERAQRLITVIMLGSFFLGYLLGGFFPAFVLLGAGYFLPWGLVAYLRRRRLGMVDDQLVDALLLMANALKAGLSLQQGLELVVREMKPPISDEFGRVVKEIHLGRLTDEALKRLAERVPLEDVQLAVDSILTLRETGGNLSETFQVIAHTIVERKKVQGKIKAMTAQGMSQGILVCCFPIGMMLLFTFIDPNYMRPFFNTPLGWLMMALVFVLDGLGLWLMFKLVKVEV
jgi:tight adherence protein B